jgi:Icc protein
MNHIVVFSQPEQTIAMRLIWITDLHLDSTDKDRVRKFFQVVIAEKPDALLIGGDISNGINSLLHLKHLARLIKKPFYFVLGNHDFYFGSIYQIRAIAHQANKEFEHAHYLTDSGVIGLTNRTALVGHDGWNDAREGDFLTSSIMLHDYLLIDELKNLNPRERMEMLHKLGDEAAESLRKVLLTALPFYERVIILTHTPPFREACLYEGEICDDDWAPHFVSKAVGEMLVEVVSNYPDKEVLVLCGHSHHRADRQILPNLRVLAGHCDVGNPAVQGIIEVS